MLLTERVKYYAFDFFDYIFIKCCALFIALCVLYYIVLQFFSEVFSIFQKLILYFQVTTFKLHFCCSSDMESSSSKVRKTFKSLFTSTVKLQKTLRR